MWMWSTGINRNIVECKAFKHNGYEVSSDAVLIETLWNVKLVEIKNLWCVEPGINRNIVECKVLNLKILLCRKAVLIETLWNVKRILPSFSFNPASVLIETLWNVKTVRLEKRRTSKHVLIETLWNVKKNVHQCI